VYVCATLGLSLAAYVCCVGIKRKPEHGKSSWKEPCGGISFRQVLQTATSRPWNQIVLFELSLPQTSIFCSLESLAAFLH